MQKVTPFLWLNGQAEEAMHFYTSIFKNSKPGTVRWLQDKYGVSWQIVPSILGKMLGDKDLVKSQRVMQTVMQMDKLHIGGLERAWRG